MNPQKAAEHVLCTLNVRSVRDPDGSTVEHARWMLDGIAFGYVQHEIAHRWLGYAQAILVLNGEVTLDEMKTINKQSVE